LLHLDGSSKAPRPEQEALATPGIPDRHIGNVNIAAGGQQHKTSGRKKTGLAPGSFHSSCNDQIA
jgi:hypothetical protein